MTTGETLIKSTGATFTPRPLASFIARKIVNLVSKEAQGGVLKILDPSCGDGSLLEAIRAECEKHSIKNELYGYDINEDYLEQARENIAGEAVLINQDFLTEQKADLFNSTLNARHKNYFDVVIANPPYVRTQLLGADYSKKLAALYNLKGKVDLYHAFIIKMTQCMKAGAVVGLITSNKFISNKSGSHLRSFLSKNFEISELHDLGDTKLFSAAVLPAILFGRKSPSPRNNNAKFHKTYQDFAFTDHSSAVRASSKYQVLACENDATYKLGNEYFAKSTGKLKFIANKDSNWSLLSDEEAHWVDTIEARSSSLIKDVLKVRVGIKSTADKVFIRDDWEVQHPEIEDELLVDLISQENISSWTLKADSSLKVLYPYDLDSSKRKLLDVNHYPGAAAYFKANERVLRGRKYLTSSGRQWYELWVPQKPHLWKQPKLVFPDISDQPRFYLDFSGKVVNGNCYWITAKNDTELSYLYLIQAVANSRFMTRYHDLVFMNKLYSGRRRYMTQYVERYPLPDVRSTTAERLIFCSKASATGPKEEAEIVQEIEDLLTNYYFTD